MNKVLILQIENRKDDNLKTLMKSNEKYCNKYNYKYIFLESGDINIPFYWWKVFELYKIMNKYPEYEYYMWMDSDAFIVKNIDLLEHLKNIVPNYKKYSMFICPDPPGWGNDDFMAGVFLIKNNNFSKELIQYWASLYNPEKWIFKNNWKCKNCKWAGIDYEQGSFSDLVFRNPKFKCCIYKLPFYVFHTIDCETIKKECFSIHLAGSYKNKIPSCYKNYTLNKIITKFQLELNQETKNRNYIYYFFIIIIIIFLFIK